MQRLTQNRKTLAGALAALAFAGMVPGMGGVRAESDFRIYGDQLESGWMNWSWARVDFGATGPVSSGDRSIAVSGGAWEAVYLHHDPFDSARCTDLVFRIHGGTTGGQRLGVQATLGGKPQTMVQLPPLVANAWRQYSIPLVALGVAGRTEFDGFWIQDTSGGVQPTWYLDDVVLRGPEVPSEVRVTVRADQVLRPMDARHFGVNVAAWDENFDTPATIRLLKEMGNRALRFPGSSLADEYHWESNTSWTNSWEWATSFDRFARVAMETGAQVFITVNYGTGTPEEAAGWVRHSNLVRGYGIRYWEVGNEVFGEWETDHNDRPHDPRTYATRFAGYFREMKRVDPSIRVGAVVTAGEETYAKPERAPVMNPRTRMQRRGWTPVMLSTLRSLGVIPDFVVHRRHVQLPGGESDWGLLNTSVGWTVDAADLRQQLNDYLGTSASSVELVATEVSSVARQPGKQTVSLVGGLFLADSIASAMRTEFNAALWWMWTARREVGNNQSDSLHGWRPYGDYGMLHAVADPGPADRYPAYHAARLLQHFGRPGDLVVEASSEHPVLAVHGARCADGSLALLVVNKGAGRALQAHFELVGFAPAGAATRWSYGREQDDAARLGRPGTEIAVVEERIEGARFTRTFPPYSASVLRLSGAVESVPPAERRPDALARVAGAGEWAGDDVWQTDGAHQVVVGTIGDSGTVVFEVRVENNGSVEDSFVLRGPARAEDVVLRYRAVGQGAGDVTDVVAGVGHEMAGLPPGGHRAVLVEATLKAGAAGRNPCEALVTVGSGSDPAKVDAVRLVVRPR